MRPLIVCLLAVVVTGCASQSLQPQPTSIQSVLAGPDRLSRDLERDATSRPDVIVPLLGLRAGDRVADIFGGGGYYSEILAGVVGENGEVLLHNNGAYNQFAAKALNERFEGRSLPNVTRHNAEVDDLQLGSATLDAAMIIMSYHDLYYVDEEGGWPAIDADAFLAQIHDALVPGGRFLIVDHVAAAGTGTTAAQTLHRIDPAFARKDIEGHGFRLMQASDALHNPADDHTLNVFDPAIRFSTDRFVHVYVKP